MIVEILAGVSVVLNIVIIYLLIRNDSDMHKLGKRVDLKSLQLKERAIDMQIANTQGFLQSLQGQQEEEEEEEKPREPVGFRRQ